MCFRISSCYKRLHHLQQYPFSTNIIHQKFEKYHLFLQFLLTMHSFGELIWSKLSFITGHLFPVISWYEYYQQIEIKISFFSPAKSSRKKEETTTCISIEELLREKLITHTTRKKEMRWNIAKQEEKRKNKRHRLQTFVFQQHPHQRHDDTILTFSTT